MNFNQPKTYALAVTAIMVLAVCVRLPLLNGSFWLDEAAQALESSRPLSNLFELSHDFQPPVYSLLVHVFTYFGSAEWWLRLSSILPALLTLYLTIRLAQRLLGQQGSLMAGLLLATSQFFVFFSQELRPYALASLWGTLALYLLVVRPRSKWLIIVNALGLLTVYTYVLVILGQIVLVLSSKIVSLKFYLISLSLSLLLCLPWLPSFAAQFQVGALLRQSLPGWDQVVSPPVLKALPLVFQKFIVGRVAIPNHSFGLVIHGLITVAVVALSLFSFRHLQLKALFYYFWSIIVLGFILNFFIPILDPKRILFVLPVFFILVTGGLLQFKKYLLLLLILLFFNFIILYSYWTAPDLQREPWRQAIITLEQQAPNSAVVVFAFNHPFPPWEWYQTRHLSTLSSGYLVNQNQDSLDPRFISLLNQNDVYVFDYLMDLTDPNRLISGWLTAAGFRETSSQQYPGLGKIRLYQKNPSFALTGNMP